MWLEKSFDDSAFSIDFFVFFFSFRTILFIAALSLLVSLISFIPLSDNFIVE